MEFYGHEVAWNGLRLKEMEHVWTYDSPSFPLAWTFYFGYDLPLLGRFLGVYLVFDSKILEGGSSLCRIFRMLLHAPKRVSLKPWCLVE